MTDVCVRCGGEAAGTLTLPGGERIVLCPECAVQAAEEAIKR